MDRATIPPGANYTVTEPTGAEDIPTNVQITGTLDADGFARIEIPPQYGDYQEFDITYEQNLTSLLWYQRYLNRIMGGVQAVSGAVILVGLELI